MEAIKGSDLPRLRNVCSMITYIELMGMPDKYLQVIADAWVRKSMLLVTGEHDAFGLLRGVVFNGLRYPFIRAYGCRTKSVRCIILLLNELWRYPAFNEAESLSVLEIEDLLSKRAEELTGMGRFNLPVISDLAALINDHVGDGRGSRAAEDIINRLAIPRLVGRFWGAYGFEENFRLSVSRKRFYAAYIRRNGLISDSFVKWLTEQISSPKSGGRELAETMLAVAKAEGKSLTLCNLLRLESLARGMNRFASFNDFRKYLKNKDMLVNMLEFCKAEGDEELADYLISVVCEVNLDMVDDEITSLAHLLTITFPHRSEQMTGT